MAQNIDAPDPVEDTFTPRMPSLSTPNLPQVNTESINLGTLPTVPPSFTPEPATSTDHSTTATPVEPAKPTVEEKKNETKPATNPMFGPIRILVMPVRSLIQPVVKGLGDVDPLVFTQGEELPLDDVSRRLVENAYTRVDLVMDRGEFAVRGGIIDVFPPNRATSGAHRVLR